MARNYGSSYCGFWQNDHIQKPQIMLCKDPACKEKKLMSLFCGSWLNNLSLRAKLFGRISVCILMKEANQKTLRQRTVKIV